MATGILKPWVVSLCLCLAFSSLAFAADAPPAGLSVAKAGPTGEVSSLASANEVRVVFSDPMVALGRIPEVVQAPYFKIVPPVPGSFRWSGTKVLIFTPAKGTTLPFGTKYSVTIDAAAASVDGKKLAAPYVFSFTTPTVKLLNTDWYRQDGRYDSPAVIILRFNQAVRPEDVAQHALLEYSSHEKDFTEPTLPKEGLEKLKALDPKAQEDFQAKLGKTLLAVKAKGPIEFSLAQDWRKKRYPPSPDMVVLITKTAPPPDSWIKVRIDKGLKGLQGPEAPPKVQTYTIQAEPAFFVSGVRCTSGCDPEDTNFITFHGSVKKRAYLLAEALFGDADVRQVLKVNEYQGAVYFNKEAFESLLWHLAAVAAIDATADPARPAGDVPGAIRSAFEVIQTLCKAEAQSGYQVEKLKTALEA